MRKSLFVALSGLFLVSAAHADLIIDGAKKAPVQTQPIQTQPAQLAQVAPHAPAQELTSEKVYGKVIQLGTPDKAAQAQLVSGWGDKVALKDALRQVLPGGFSVTPDEHLNLDKQVSWEGGQPWVVVLDHMTRMYDFNVTVDWTRRQISVSPVAPPQARSLAAAQHTTGLSPIASTSIASPSAYASRTTACVSGCASTFSAPVKVIPAAPVEQSWILDPSKTLKENVEAWGKQAGWTVKWNAVNYNVAAKVVLHGGFTANDGPVATLINAYEQADQPLVAHMTTMDHVLSVENKNYQPSQVVALDQDPNVSKMMDANRYPATPDRADESGQYKEKAEAHVESQH